MTYKDIRVKSLSFGLWFEQLAPFSFESKMEISADCLLISTVSLRGPGLLNQVNYQPVPHEGEEWQKNEAAWPVTLGMDEATAKCGSTGG